MTRGRLGVAVALGAALLAARLPAGEITETFSSVTQRDATTTAVWNLVRARLHMPYVVDRLNGGGTEDDAVDIGTGTDGALEPSTYSSFDANPATPAVIELDTSRDYHFTTIEIASGITVTGSGSSPLVLRAQGAVTIDGILDVSGGPGDNTQPGGGSASSGGVACCGGGNGGVGGGLGSNGADGASGDAGNTGRGRGGAPSVNNGAGNGGGGGGGGGFSDVTIATNGSQSGTGGAGGARGNPYNDEYLATLEGGSGGGGGAGYDLDQGDWRGGGGGAGGGAVQIVSGDDLTINFSGSVLANGGDGGTLGGSGNHAGGGGGGSGGAIVLFSAGVLSNAGSVSAVGGTGGTGGNGGDGGNGAAGRARFEDSDGGAFTGTGSENPNPLAPGQVFYRVGTRVVVTRSYDTGSESPVYLGFNSQETTPAGSTVTYEVAGSRDNFQSDDTGYVPTSSLSTLDGRRYVRFRVSLTSVDRNTTPEVLSFTLSYFDGAFRFAYASCAGARGGAAGGSGGLWLLVALLPWLTRFRRLTLRARR